MILIIGNAEYFLNFLKSEDPSEFSKLEKSIDKLNIDTAYTIIENNKDDSFFDYDTISGKLEVWLDL